MEKLRMRLDCVGKGCRLLIVTLLMAASNSTARGADDAVIGDLEQRANVRMGLRASRVAVAQIDLALEGEARVVAFSASSSSP
jgi:hypothetical protein